MSFIAGIFLAFVTRPVFTAAHTTSQRHVPRCSHKHQEKKGDGKVLTILRGTIGLPLARTARFRGCNRRAGVSSRRLANHHVLRFLAELAQVVFHGVVRHFFLGVETGDLGDVDLVGFALVWGE
jgi:hypothetical protein